MKKIFAFLFCSFALCGLAFAQSKLPEFEKVKEIRLLESNRKEVKRILADYEADDSEYDSFSTENADIEIDYSQGDCSEEDSEEAWNVAKWKVTRIEISVRTTLHFEDLGIDSSNFRKEQKYANIDNLYIYHNKNLGIAFEVDEDEEFDEVEIKTIFLFPPNALQSLLCNNEEGEDFRKFYSQESFFRESDLEKRESVTNCGVPSVTSLTLSANEIIIGCNDSAEKKVCSDSDRKISVTTNGNDPQNDPITYLYTVSGGEIIGKGAEIVWDLTGVEAGTYTITAGVDDGCGICGPTKTETVVVKNCPDCLAN